MHTPKIKNDKHFLLQFFYIGLMILDNSNQMFFSPESLILTTPVTRIQADQTRENWPNNWNWMGYFVFRGIRVSTCTTNRKDLFF